MNVSGFDKRCPRCHVDFSGTQCPVCVLPAGKPLVQVFAEEAAAPPSSRAPLHYLNRAAIGKRVRAAGKRAGQPFLVALNRKVERLIDAACRVHNGGKITLDLAVADQVGLLREGRK